MGIRNQRTNPQEHVAPEVGLWRSVVKLALDDAMGVTKVNSTDEAVRKEGIRNQDRARSWLLSRSRDFRQVCSLAGLDPDAVYDSAVKLASNGWRAQCAS